MSEETKKPDEEIETVKCAICDEQLPVTWVMQSYDGYIVYVDENHQFAHRHNISSGKKGKAKAAAKEKDTRAPSSIEKKLLAEYFKDPSQAPTSAQLLARKAAGGDMAGLRELHKRYGVDQPHKYDTPVQVVIGNGGGDSNDPRPVMNIRSGLLSEGWDEEDEEEYRQSEEDTH